jgi:hypothetical protein
MFFFFLLVLLFLSSFLHSPLLTYDVSQVPSRLGFACFASLKSWLAMCSNHKAARLFLPVPLSATSKVCRCSGPSSSLPDLFTLVVLAIAKTFRIGRQEDSHEFMRYVMDTLQNNVLASFPKSGSLPSSSRHLFSFSFGLTVLSSQN